MTAELTIEKIQTGLTANYIHDWTLLQGLKEAMQNIAYGAIKSGTPANMRLHDPDCMPYIEDAHTGFEKRHLYIGESGQRDDEDGLGTFGEGWKIFLLVMARNNITHEVDTVGFSFWGTMEPTEHDTEVLVINVVPNTREIGTLVMADIEPEIWERATRSFAVLQGIDPKLTRTNTCLEGRSGGELWVQGVRIENNETTNPLNLYYSYNLTQRNLINRDRSHVNTEEAYNEIRKLIYFMEYNDVAEFVSKALDGEQAEDILRGPYVPGLASAEQKKIWTDVLAELHACKASQLLIPSYNGVVNDEVKRKGYTLLDTPRKWDFELTYMGIKKADDVVGDGYKVVENTSSYGGVTKEEKSVLSKVRKKMKSVFSLNSVDELPQFQQVAEIRSDINDINKNVYYEAETGVVYLTKDIMENEVDLFTELLPELVIWKYKASTSEEFEQAYKRIITNMAFR